MKKCPKCSEGLLEIVYGMPGPELCEVSERGEIVLGGCRITDDGPAYHCRKCKMDYSRDLKRSYKSNEGEDE